MFCNKCGHKIQEGVTFCPNCGNNVVAKDLGSQEKKSISINRKTPIFLGGAVILFLAVLIYFSMFHIPKSDLRYSYQDGIAIVASYKGNDTEVVIPSEVKRGWKTYSVTEIGSCAFLYCDSLTNIEIPNSVTKIGRSAFECCDSLTSIEIPNSVTKIEERTFRCCRSLTSIEIPDGVTEIGSSAFGECDSLTSIRVPADLELDDVGLPPDCIVYTYQELSLYGTWIDEEKVISFTFCDDGTIRVAGLSDILGADLFTFTEIDKNTLQLKVDSDNSIANLVSVNLDYEISGNVMTVEIAGQKYKLMQYE